MDEKDEERDFGPADIGAMQGVCVGLYIKNGVSKKDLLGLIGDLYDGILDAAIAKGKEREARNARKEKDGD